MNTLRQANVELAKGQAVADPWSKLAPTSSKYAPTSTVSPESATE